jgi:hypothetical protein
VLVELSARSNAYVRLGLERIFYSARIFLENDRVVVVVVVVVVISMRAS